MFLRKKLYYVLILALCMLSVSACKQKKEKTDNSSVEVFTINDYKVYLDEVLYRVYKSESENSYYSKDYQKQYGTSYWDSEMMKGSTVRECLKEQLYDEIVRDSLLYKKAIEKGYELTNEEKTACLKKALEQWDALTKEERKIIGLSKVRITEFEKNKAIVEKYFSTLLDTYQVDEDSIRNSVNPDDYKQIDIQTIGYSKFSYDEDGKQTRKSSEENEMGLESLKELEAKAKKEIDFNNLLTDDYDMLETEEMSIIPGETACDEVIEKKAQTLKTGETSNVIETDSGCYIIKVISNSSDSKNGSSEAFEEKVTEEIRRAKYKQFDAYFETVKKDADIQKTEKWDDIIVGGTVIKES